MGLMKLPMVLLALALLTMRSRQAPGQTSGTIEEAGKQNVPFYQFVNRNRRNAEDRVDTLLAIRDLHRHYGHVQEVIIQNFVEPDIPMTMARVTGGELRALAVVRLLMPAVIEAPPIYRSSGARWNQRLGRNLVLPDFVPKNRGCIWSFGNARRPRLHFASEVAGLSEFVQRSHRFGFAGRKSLPLCQE
jgi:hypothetical protein